jgi:hypothetical protein
LAPADELRPELAPEEEFLLELAPCGRIEAKLAPEEEF